MNHRPARSVWRVPQWPRLHVYAAALLVNVSAMAATTTLTVNSQTVGTGESPQTMLFPVARSGDLGYDAIVTYHTANGSAFAGIDYTAASGTLVVPAGVASATIPVDIAANSSNDPSQDFTLLIDSATGVGPAAVFGPTPVLSRGSAAGIGQPAFVDMNEDGSPDIIASLGNKVAVWISRGRPLFGIGYSDTPLPIFTVSAGSYWITTADLNGDGKPDVVSGNTSANSVTVLVNTTPGGGHSPPTVSSQQISPAGTQPFSFVATADIDGDGKPDLIVASSTRDPNSGDGGVSVLLNTTAPGSATVSFGAQQSWFPSTSSHTGLAVVDMNGDGKPDLVLAGATVTVLLNTTVPGSAAATFAAPQFFPGFSLCMAVGDINGDGKPDVVIADPDYSVLLNTTTAGSASVTFGETQSFPTPNFYASAIAVVDTNGDGKSDVVMSALDVTHATVMPNQTRAGSAVASFGDAQYFATGSSPWFLATGDGNGDGMVELATSNIDDATITVLFNETPIPTAIAPSFSTQQTFAAGSSPAAAAVADMNNDGRPDLVVADASVGVEVLLDTTVSGAMTSSFSAPSAFGTGGAVSVATADFNGDGVADVVTAEAASSDIAVLLNTTAAGATAPSLAAQQTFAVGATPKSVATADFNRDGKSDIVVANFGGNTVSVLLDTAAPGATSASFSAQQAFATGDSPLFVASADFNNDGLPDIVVANKADNTVSVLLNTMAFGAVTPSFAAQQTFATGANPSSVAAIDVNGDGIPDLVVTNFDDNTVSVLLGTTARLATSASFAAQQTYATGPAPKSVFVAGTNRKALPDLIVANSGDNTVSVFLNKMVLFDGTFLLAPPQTFNTGASPTYVVAADVNGDGKPDLITTNPSQANGNTVSVLLNTQYQVVVAGSPATGTILHEHIFANGFE
jgi:trimeric autotransporter adhesin